LSCVFGSLFCPDSPSAAVELLTTRLKRLTHLKAWPANSSPLGTCLFSMSKQIASTGSPCWLRIESTNPLTVVAISPWYRDCGLYGWRRRRDQLVVPPKG